MKRALLAVAALALIAAACAPAEDDGSIEILIAHEDPGPGCKNWLNTLGHSEGGMLGRIVGAEGGWPAEWKTEVVKFADVKS